MASALLIFLAAGVLLLHPALFGDQVLWAGGYFVRIGPFSADVQAQASEGVAPLSDSVHCFLPWLRFAADSLRADGSLPLWKDTAGAGAPLVGNGQSALFFPTNLVAILLGAPPIVHALTALLKLSAGAFGAWLLARHLRLSFTASVLCGLLFGFGGFQVAWNLFPLSNVSLLLPVLVLAVDRLALRPSAAGLALLAGIAGLQHLGGHPETAFHCQVTALLLGCARSVSLRAASGWGLVFRRIGWIVAGLCLGLLLGAIQVLPLLEYIAHSEMLQRRSHQVTPPLHPWAGAALGLGLLFAVLALRRLARAERGSVVAALVLGGATVGALLAGLTAGMLPTFVQTLAPDWFGPPGRSLGPGHYVAHVGAFAGAAYPLAVLGLLAGQPRGLVRTAGVVAGVGLLAGVGAPLVIDLLHRLPLFDVAKNERLSLLALLATAVLAAFGLDALPSLRNPGARRRLLFAVLMPALGAFVALACGVRLGLVTSSNVPARAHKTLVEARLLPEADIAPFFADEPPLDVSEPGKLFHGYVVTPAPATAIRLLYGRLTQAARTQWKVAPIPKQPRSGAPTRWAYMFRATLPRAGQPHELSQVRLEVELDDQTAANSASLISPDDRPVPLLPFPAQPAPGTSMAPLACLSFGALALIVLWPVRRGSTAQRLALLLTLAASLTPFVRALLPFVPGELFYPSSKTLDALAAARPDGRIVNLEPGRMGAEIPTYYGISDARGYDALQPARVARLFDLALQQPLAPDFGLLGLLSVRLITHCDTRSGAQSANSLDLVENAWFLPRARLVGGAEIEADDDSALARLRDPAFPRERAVVLAAGVARDPPAAEVGTARIALNRPDRVRVEVAAAVPAWLVLSDTDFPGWSVWVDDQPREIVRANVAFRAVAVQPGDRVVEFRYEPLSFRAGASLSAMAALLLVAGLLRSRRHVR